MIFTVDNNCLQSYEISKLTGKICNALKDCVARYRNIIRAKYVSDSSFTVIGGLSGRHLLWLYRLNCGYFRGELGLQLHTLVQPLVKDTRAARPYLLSDGQNMYNRVVLVCTVNVYIPASLGRRPILRCQVLQVPTKL